ncbi:MAG TPA: hypothetical protein EYP05_01170 [Piscirickettsiaceae bacterium]|nr:hypothetical protein [Piscirickettsiaceae bacterium]HIQ39711.1 hypothetical protein [Sulfurivirga caldicuralii]
MWLKLFTALLVAAFLYYLVRHRLRQRRLEKAGLPIPQQSGMRPITILALLMLGMYLGYLLFYLLTR